MAWLGKARMARQAKYKEVINMVFQPKYSWRNVVFPVKAEEAGEELRRIQEKHGAVTPSILLEESRDEDAVMHKCYEWDNDKAAEKWRLQQSRLIMSCLTVTYEAEEGEGSRQIEVRAFQNTSEKREGSFIHVEDALSSEVYRDIVLRRAYSELAAFRHKYADLQELSKVFCVIDSVIEM